MVPWISGEPPRLHQPKGARQCRFHQPRGWFHQRQLRFRISNDPQTWNLEVREFCFGQVLIAILTTEPLRWSWWLELGTQKTGAAGPQAAWGTPSYADVPASTSLQGSAATAPTATSAAGDGDLPRGGTTNRMMIIDVLFPLVGWLIEGRVYPFNSR